MKPLLLLALVPAAAWAGEADWTSYLCEYGSRTDLVRVNPAQQRVTIDGKDQGRVVIDDGAVRFVRHRGGDSIISKKSGTFVTMGPGYAPIQGKCRVVND